METQENSVDPVLQALSQSENVELAEIVKQNDPDVGGSSYQKFSCLCLLGCRKG